MLAMPSTTSRRAGAKAHRAAAPASAARNCRLRGREKSVIRPRRDEALLGRQRFAGFFAGGQWIRNFRSAVPSVVSGISAARDRAGTTFARSSRPSEFLARSGCTPPAGEEPNDRLSQSGTRSSNPSSSSGESGANLVQVVLSAMRAHRGTGSSNPFPFNWGHLSASLPKTQVRNRLAAEDHGSGDLEAARGAGALAGDKEPLTAPLRIAVIGGDIPGLAATAVVAALPNSRSMSTSRRRN
jgi:hypothetical protein